MTHPNDMTAWAEIRCQRGHGPGDHRSVERTVDLGAGHGYHDYTPVPDDLARSFRMMVWDPAAHPVDGGPYCPAHDAVSETIVSHRIWEPRETVLTLRACANGNGDQLMVDLGAQIGWFSLLAASCSTVHVLAVDADLDNLELLERSASLNPWGGRIQTVHARVDADAPLLTLEHVRVAKLDLEGAEADGLRILGPSLDAGLVDFLLVEVSPVFRPGDHYPDLVAGLIDRGYRAYRLPPKQQPPFPLDGTSRTMHPGRLDLAPREELLSTIRSWHQEDLWFAREGVDW